MDARISERTLVHLLRQAFAHFPQVEFVHRRLNELFASGCIEGQEPDRILLLGEPGTGKSTLLKRWVAQHQRVVHDTFTEVPALYAEVPFRCSTGSLASLLLRTLGSPLWDRGSEGDRVEQLTVLLRQCKVRLVALDEVNHLVDRGRERTHYQVADCLKTMGDLSFVPFAFAGIPRSRSLLDANEQLADRTEIILVEPFSAEPKAAHPISAALGVFKQLLEGVPAVDITNLKHSRAIAFATNGRLRAIRRLFVRSVQIAYRLPSPQITAKVLAQAFLEVIFPGAPDQRNPFSKRFNGAPLTKAGEPYAPRRLGVGNDRA